MSEWQPFEQQIGLRPAPDFRLPSGRGGTLSLIAFRNRRNVVLFFIPDPDPLLGPLAALYPRFAANDAEVLVILPTDEAGVRAAQARLAPPFPLLADTTGRTRAAYAALLRDTPAEECLLVVLDRYGAPFAATPHGAPDEAALREALDWVELVELQCPE